MRLNWADLLIENITPEDFQRWLGEWTGFVGGMVAPAFLNKFGTWFLRRPEGHVEMLDVFTGAVERMAETYEEFIAQVNEQAWQEVYLLSELVYKLHQADKIPGPGECYALARTRRWAGRTRCWVRTLIPGSSWSCPSAPGSRCVRRRFEEKARAKQRS